jgi:hypothetical protein
MTLPIQELDYEIIREPWNRYELDSGSHLKIRYVLTNLTKKMDVSGQKPGYNIKGQNIFELIRIPLDEKGPPSERDYSPQELEENVVDDDVKFSTLNEEWNEYFAEDGTRIKLKIMPVNIKKSKLCNREGNPIYNIQLTVFPQIKPPKR